MASLKSILRGRSRPPQANATESNPQPFIPSHLTESSGIATSVRSSSPPLLISRRERLKKFISRPFRRSSSLPGHGGSAQSPETQGISRLNPINTSPSSGSQPASNPQEQPNLDPASRDPRPSPATSDEKHEPEPSHERPSINLATQGTDGTRSTDAPHKESRAKSTLRTASHAAKQILDIATESADAFAPLKSVLGGVRAFVNYSEQYSDNKSRVSKLKSRLESLETIRLAKMDESNETWRRNLLQRELDKIIKELDRITSQSMPEKMSNIKHDEGTIADCLEDLGEALTDYQMSLQRHLLELGIRMIEEVHLLLLQQLPHAKGAGHTAGNRQRCLKGTRQELLDQIYAWAYDPDNRRVYWLNGSAGTGKSTICQSFAEWCFAHGLLGASFFCSRDFTDRNNLSLIFPTLALDLAFKYPAFRADLLDIIRTTPDVGSQSLSLQLESLLIRPLISSGISTIIVIDALDECKDDKPASAILSMLGPYIDSLKSVKFFVTGRPEAPITRGFRLPLLRPHTEVFQLHTVESGSVDHDIQLYLMAQLASLVEARNDVKFPVPWPEGSAIALLVRKAGGLFIFASTTYKYVAYTRGNPLRLLQQVLGSPDSSRIEGQAGLDLLYTGILTENYPAIYDSVDVIGPLKPILGPIVVVYDPLSHTVLEKLLGTQSDDTWMALQFLQSLLHVPESDHEPIRFYHRSFPDYLVDAERCYNPQLHVDPAEHHARLVVGSLELMSKTLKRNICNLPRYSLNAEVEDLSQRRTKYVGDALEYACFFWAKHLSQASITGRAAEKLVQLIEKLMHEQFLWWLEVLSIAASLRTAVYSLRDAKAWLRQLESQNTELLEFIEDAERFLLTFFDAINVSASHIYESAVFLSPKNSIVREHYHRDLPPSSSWNAVDDSWDVCIRKIDSKHGKCVAFSNNGDYLAACGGYEESNFLIVIEVATGIVVSTFLGHDTPVLSVAFSPDDSLLISGSKDGTVRLWDIQTGGLVRKLSVEGEVRSLGFSYDGSMVACNAGTWDGMLEKVLHKFDKRVDSLAWSLSEAKAVLGYRNGGVKTLDATNWTYRELNFVHERAVLSLAYSRDGAKIASGSVGEVIIHDAKTGRVLRSFATNYAESVCFSHEGERLVITQWKSMIIRDLASSKKVAEFVQSNWASSVSVSPDGQSIALADSDKLSIWPMNVPMRSSEATTRHSYEVSSVAISPDSSFIASGSNDGTVKLWNFATGTCTHTFEGDFEYVLDVAISPDSTLVASASDDKKIRIWRIADYALVHTLHGDNTWCTGVAFSPDGQRIASVSTDEDARLWDIKEEKTVGILEGTRFPNLGTGIRFSDDGTGIIVFDDKNSRRWKMVSPDAISFTPYDHAFDNQSSSFYKHDRHSEWITDGNGRRVCWLPQELRKRRNQAFDCKGSKVAMGLESGRVCWFDFGPSESPLDGL